LISGQKSISLTSHESINLESPQIILEGSDVKLGSKIASQPILKGNDTVKILKQMTRILQGISQILEVSQVYPSGVPVPDTAALIISGQANDALGLILKVLEDEKNGIKSNFVKTL
jgi:hypothetical protein